MDDIKPGKEPTIHFRDIIQLSQQLETDGQAPVEHLHARDVGKGSSLEGYTPAAKLKIWLREVSKENTSSLQDSIIPWLVFPGAVAGALAIVGLVLPGSQHPVNVLFFLTLFIGLQVLLVTLSLFFLLARNWSFSRLGGDMLRQLNPGKWLFFRDINALSSPVPWNRLATPISWAIFRYGQVLAIAFNMAALTTFIIILAFSDRTFGWSSTFNLSDTALHSGAQILAAPWSWITPHAGIDLNTITTTRLQAFQATFADEQLTAMRSWWPFLIACMLVYGLLPRVVLLVISTVVYQRMLIRSFLGFPGAYSVLTRMNTAYIPNPDPYASTSPSPHGSHKAYSSALPDEAVLLVNWAAAPFPDTNDSKAAQWNITVNESFSAGVALQDDRETREKINTASLNQVVIIVKSWEPPLAELKDFVLSLKQDKMVTFLLIPLNSRPVDAVDLASWQLFIDSFSQTTIPNTPRIVLGGKPNE